MTHFLKDPSVNKKWKKIFGITILVVISSDWIMLKFIFKNSDSILVDIFRLLIGIIGCLILFRILWLYKNKPEKLR